MAWIGVVLIVLGAGIMAGVVIWFAFKAWFVFKAENSVRRGVRRRSKENEAEK